MRKTDKKIVVILLAAGGSVRMGTQKLLLELGGISIVRRCAIQALASLADTVTIVTGSNQTEVREQLSGLNVDIIHNPNWKEGQASSIKCGIQFVENTQAPDGAIILAADQPFVNADHLNQLINSWELGEVIVASWVGEQIGTPVLFDRSIFSSLKELKGDKGARQIFPYFDIKPVEQGEKLLFYDVDTPKAFEAVKEIWMQRYGWKDCFPIFNRKEETPLIYLDSAATSQTPKEVIDAQAKYEMSSRANIRRGIYSLAEKSDEAYETARENVADFFGTDFEGTIFTHGATEALNLAIWGWGNSNLQKGDLVVLDTGSHHAGIVPWLMLAKQKGIYLEFIDLDEWGELSEERWLELLKKRPKAAFLTHISNVTGQKKDLQQLTSQAHEVGAIVFADCAQSAGHTPLHIKQMGVDFAAVSAHKMYGPFGIGFLWAAKKVRAIQPLLGGGGMVESVSKNDFSMTESPSCFEAGTPNITGAVGFAAACDFLRKIGVEQVERHSQYLCNLAKQQLSAINGVHILGNPKKEKISLLSFTIKNVHPHDAASFLADKGIAVRAGYHCAMPFHKAMGIPASVRASFGVYSSENDVQCLAAAVQQAIEVYGYETR